LNYAGLAYKLPSGRPGHEEYEKSKKYNYELFLNLYLDKDSNGNYTRKADMWRLDSDKNWVPIAR
jgi:hypothetical protein